MKHELPIAIGLLAIGCLPWIWQSRESSEATAAVGRPVATQSQFEAPPEQPPVEFRKVTGDQGLNQSADFLRQVAGAFNHGEPSFGYFDFENYLFDSVVKGRGGFWCGGQGSNKSRLELVLDSDSAAMVTQICDGRFLYRISEHNGSKQLKFYNLENLSNEDAGIVQATLPATWVGRSSISDLFKTLADAFNFEDMKSSTDGKYLELVGSWNADHLAKLMVNWVDHRKILPQPDWSKLPPQIPHGARLRFINAEGRWNPSEILFFRFDDKKSNQPIPALSVRFSPVHQQSISDELFQIDGSESDAIDETDLYNKRIDILTGRHRVAEDLGDKIR